VKIGYLVVAVVAAAVAVFALQNSDATHVRFLVWSVDAVPLAAVVLAALGLGLMVTGVPLAIQRWRLGARNRALQARLVALEETAAKRDEPPRSSADGH
jgi:uncharacterized integral membrane protein